MRKLQKTPQRFFSLYTILFLLLFSSAAFSRTAIGPSFFVTLPRGDFAEMAKTGGGFGVKVIRALPSVPIVSIRADLAASIYRSRESISLTTEHSPEVVATLKVARQSVRFVVGPQFELAARPVRLYAAPLIGVYHYHAAEKIDGRIAWESESASATELGGNLSAGLLVDLSRRPAAKFDLALDLGVQYHAVNQALGPWPLLDSATGDAREVVVALGVLFTF